MSLSPWDLSGSISFDFSLYRPRRPSYVFATQTARQRNESYRHATKHPSAADPQGELDPAGGGGARKKRKESYRAATGQRPDDIEDLEDPELSQAGNHAPVPDVVDGCPQPEPEIEARRGKDSEVSRRRYTKNLLVMSVSFVLVLTAFRALQNVQSSLNAADRLGVISMTSLHCAMFVTSPFAPAVVARLGSKWTAVVGMTSYLFWIGANCCPHFYTLVPTSVGVGVGQSLAWSAQVAYMRHLVADYERESGSGSEAGQRTLYLFNAVFLTCFQTSHVWGNLVSSLVLANEPKGQRDPMDVIDEEFVDPGSKCGIYDPCHETIPYTWNFTESSTVRLASSGLLTMMGTYLVFAFLGLVLMVIFLDGVKSSKDEPEKPCIQIMTSQVNQLMKHRNLCRLIPILIFNGFEQGFVYADYNKSYISCTVGIEYIGYSMIVLGVTNSVFSFVVGATARHIPREAVIGIGAILHVGLMVFLLVWIPDRDLVAVFFVVSALWGVCDAIWQTQSNHLVKLCCPDETELAFQNLRLLQCFGASAAFVLSIFFCVSIKLYVLISLLAVSILLYVVVEYNLRRDAQMCI